MWECSLDLVSFISARKELHTGNAIDLGCGYGLPGIKCLQLGVKDATFLDFNKEVTLCYRYKRFH